MGEGCKWSAAFACCVVLVLPHQLLAQTRYRLDGKVLPDAYDVTIKPYLLPEDGARQFTFDGEVNITLHTPLAGVNEIMLHKDYIEISSVQLYDASNRAVPALNVDVQIYDAITTQLTLRLSDVLQANSSYVLRFVYTGQIHDGMAGLYRASYTDANGTQKWLALTQLQRIDARTLFPCFDEPALKAKFRMHISRQNQFNSQFNTAFVSGEPDGNDRYLDHFEETPPMSTYLVAVIVSDFVTISDAELVFIIQPEHVNKTYFSFEVAHRVLRAYDDYTQLPYSELGIPLMKKAGSPIFPHNGMENWGLVIYRDSVLVHEPNYTDGWADKEYTITILAHETAHMWFGNSVTFAWWSYFWLNEAFARYYQYFMAHEIYPEYQLDLQFIVNQVHLIFSTDAVNSTQPMTSPEESVNTPTEIGRKFSSIAYAKGAAIVRMINNLMGSENFKAAIRAYLKENHLKSVVPEQLFTHLKQHWPSTQQVDLDQFFFDWTEQVGFPMLNVSLASDRKTVTIRQARFLLNAGDGSDATLRYTIPITYTTNVDADFTQLEPKFYLEKSANYKVWQLEHAADWIVFNLQQSNYHRVFYESHILRGIQKALSLTGHSGIHVANRAHIVDDLFNFGRVALLEYDAVFEFMEYLATETEHLPWYAAFSGLQRIAQRLAVEQEIDFIRFLYDITKAVYEKLGFQSDQDTVLDVYNRNRVISWVCRYRLYDCNEQARQIFMESMSTGVKPSPDFRETLYCSATRFGEFDFYNALEELYKNESFGSEQEMLLRAMGCTYHFIEYHYARILSNEIPLEYKRTALTPLYTKNADNITPVFQMITATVDRLATALGSWSSVSSVITDISNYFTTEEQRELLADFIAEKGDLFDSKVPLYNALNTVEANLKWSRERLGPLLVYLEGRSGAGAIVAFSTLFVIAIVSFLM